MSAAQSEAYEVVIGMEVHAELLTESKMFCSCRNAFGGEPNTRCCPVCVGMPGSLPVINRRAVEFVARAALALNCRINPVARFDRKNYFYPDLPKGYQISEYDQPIGVDGWIDIDVGDDTRRVRIQRVHLEEDTGKLFHLPGGGSAIDYNRSGVPLMEIVTAFPPDIRTAQEARAYLVALRSILTYIGVSDGRMEEGSLRCEPNLSVRETGSSTYGTKTEIKNLNSFRAVQRGIEYEVARHIGLLRSGMPVLHETRGWNEAKQETVVQRSKEVEQEYRYFPEPDLPPLRFEPADIEAIRRAMPELPAAARRRLMERWGLGAAEAEFLTQSPAHAAYFDATVEAGAAPNAAANWMMGELARLLNASNLDVSACRVTPESLAGLLRLVADGSISGKMAKSFFERMFETGESANRIAASEGGQIRDEGTLAAIIDDVLRDQESVWRALLAGDEKKMTFLIGQVMKVSRGKANPQEVGRLLRERLEKER